MRTFQHKHSILLACDESMSQYIQCGDTLYHAQWMKPIDTDIIKYEVAKVIIIEKDEYDILYEAIEKGDDIPIESDEPKVEEHPIEPETEVTIEYVKEMKISELSTICNNVITNGLDIVLTDEKLYHFSLTTQDQLNLITLSSMIASGENAIPYHADGELCRFYTATDIQLIVNAATAFKTYHVSYFNSLKSYVEALNDIKAISEIEYGIDIPTEYQSDVLKVLLQQATTGSE